MAKKQKYLRFSSASMKNLFSRLLWRQVDTQATHSFLLVFVLRVFSFSNMAENEKTLAKRLQSVYYFFSTEPEFWSSINLSHGRLREPILANDNSDLTKNSFIYGFPRWSLSTAPGARFSKAPVTFRARNQIFKSKYKE